MIGKVKFLLLGALFTSFNLAMASNALECDSTWSASAAAASCGSVCTNPHNSYHYPFSSSYNAEKDECTFNSGCCENMPFQICAYRSAVCDRTSITVKKGDNHFHNNHGKFEHD